MALLSEIDNSGTGRSILGFGANDRPNLVGDPESESSAPPDVGSILRPSPFRRPARLEMPGRNILDGPGYQNVNASLVKNTDFD